MVKVLLGLADAPSPHDAADALAVALCHAHCAGVDAVRRAAVLEAPTTRLRSWRQYRPPLERR
jgi:hypothetical protein